MCSLQDILVKAAKSTPSHGLIFHLPGAVPRSLRLEYHALYSQAKDFANALRRLPSFEEQRPVLIRMDEHSDNIHWFWAVLFANAWPVLLSPFSNIAQHRQQQLRCLSDIFQSPLCITRDSLLPSFGSDNHHLQIFTHERFSSGLGEEHAKSNTNQHDDLRLGENDSDRTAILMMTSGSTGDAKAVPLSHAQVLASLSGKASIRHLPPNRPLLNWIGLDHVAGLIEIHLLALYLGVDQIHVGAVDMVSDPALFLDLLSLHRVAHCFAPNFFMAKLVAEMRRMNREGRSFNWDFRDLMWLGSGGEANDIETYRSLSTILSEYGARPDVIVPGFGMTETCAGCIYNLKCSTYDLGPGHGGGSLAVGKCMPGVNMRIRLSKRKRGLVGDGFSEEGGDLEIRGDVVMRGYYRNPQANTKAFTADGWFKTGDRAIINDEGDLSLIGRETELFNINGLKFDAADVRRYLDQALSTHASRTICFASRAARDSTKRFIVICVPKDPISRDEQAVEIHQAAQQAFANYTGSSCETFTVSNDSLLPITTLGKVSLSKMRRLYDEGHFEHCVQRHQERIEADRLQHHGTSMDAFEQSILADFSAVLGIETDVLAVESSVYDAGFTSMDLIRLKRRIDSRLGTTIPLVIILKNPTVRSLALKLRPYCVSHMELGQTPTVPYEPVVVLKADGSRTPLWLIHPGVGEVSVFINLARCLVDDDRPVYALRARGFDSGQQPFSSLAEIIHEYHRAIKSWQPHGPYALAGYSYGAMLAFEVAKLLGHCGHDEKVKDEKNAVRFLGSFNLPPHIKTRMQQLNWNRCLLSLVYFLGMTTEEHASKLLISNGGSCDSFDRDKVLEVVLESIGSTRMEELGLSRAGLKRWADIAHGLQSKAIDYEPQGKVDVLDVFCAIPLKAVAGSREEWRADHLSRWQEFCQTRVQFHDVAGAHYTMLDSDNVSNFSEILKKALQNRGL